MKTKQLEKELQELRKRVEDLEKKQNPVWVGPYYVPVPYPVPVPVYPRPYWPQPWYQPSPWYVTCQTQTALGQGIGQYQGVGAQQVLAVGKSGNVAYRQ